MALNLQGFEFTGKLWFGDNVGHFAERRGGSLED
jgi:hypothetical protein